VHTPAPAPVPSSPVKKYLFADESGNFDFRDHRRYPGASRYFAVGTLLLTDERRRHELQSALLNLRFELARQGKVYNEVFHAATDDQWVRDAVFNVLKDIPLTVDVTILEKAKAQPHIRRSEECFHQHAWYAWYYHLRFHGPRYFGPDDDLLLVSAALGAKKTRAAFRGAVTSVANQVLDRRIRTKNMAFWPQPATPASRPWATCRGR